MGLRFAKIEEKDTQSARYFAKDAQTETEQERVSKDANFLEVSNIPKKQQQKAVIKPKINRIQAGVFLGVSAFLGVCWWMASAFTTPKVSTDVKKLNFYPVYTLNTPNANDYYIKAINVIDLESIKWDWDWESKTIPDLEKNNWHNQKEKEAVFAKVRTVLDKNRAALDALSQARNLPYTPYYYPKNEGKYSVKNGFELPYVNSERLLMLTSIGYADAIMSMKKREYVKSITRSLDIITFAHNLQKENIDNSFVYGIMLQQYGIDSALQSVNYLNAQSAREKIRKLEKFPDISLAQMLKIKNKLYCALRILVGRIYSARKPPNLLL
jgi:hypothetical protein